MAEGEVVGAELGFQMGAVDARLDTGTACLVVDFEDAIETTEIEAENSAVISGRAAIFGAATDAGAAAEGNHGDVVLSGPRQDVCDVVFAVWVGDEVGCGREIAVEGTDDIAEGFAVGVNRTMIAILRHNALKFLRNFDLRRRHPKRI